MGAYLSEPVTEKVSSDESNEKLECGASSMQGWRVNQEVPIFVSLLIIYMLFDRAIRQLTLYFILFVPQFSSYV